MICKGAISSQVAINILQRAIMVALMQLVAYNNHCHFKIFSFFQVSIVTSWENLFTSSGTLLERRNGPKSKSWTLPARSYGIFSTMLQACNHSSHEFLERSERSKSDCCSLPPDQTGVPYCLILWHKASSYSSLVWKVGMLFEKYFCFPVLCGLCLAK